MKRLFLAAVAVMMAVMSVSAQVKIETPHPDLDVKVQRCAFANGTLIVDMLWTNYGPEEAFIYSYNTFSNFLTAYDDEGNVYTHKNAKLLIGILSQGVERNPTMVMPTEVPLKVRVQIEGISNNASKLTLLEIGINSRKGVMRIDYKKPLRIRNLEWAK